MSIDSDYTDTDTDTSSGSYLVSESSDDNISQTENLDLNFKIINNYNVIYELGRGSYSIVWLAFNINNQNFYALKVQNPSEYKEGVDEINFVKKLPEKPCVFNNLYESFIEFRDDNKYLCSVWNLHCSNIDSVIRKGDFKSGLPLFNVKYIMRQLIDAIKILHLNFKVFHGDIKTDNILIKGINNRDAFIISEYLKVNFNEIYTREKKEFWIKKGQNINKINNMNKNDKLRIRLSIHQKITHAIMEKINNSDISKNSIDSKYLESIKISLGDFGTCCSEDNYYEESFGTRYYQAPEIILMGQCSYPVDIWALGCTFYELLTGAILFNPKKDSNHSRDYYHLCLINDVCGNFPSKFLKKTKFCNDFFDSKNNIINRNNNLDDRFKINLENIQDDNKKIINDLLIQMLEIDPNKRINITELSKNKFFEFV